MFIEVATTKGNEEMKQIRETATILNTKFVSADFVKLLNRKTTLKIVKLK